MTRKYGNDGKARKTIEDFVCVKQVPGTTEVKMNPETNTLIREGIPNVVNPFDLYAVEKPPV